MPRPEEKRLKKMIRSIFNSTFINSVGRFRLAMQDFHNRLDVVMDSFEGDNAEGTGGSVRECFPLLDQLTNMLHKGRKRLEASLADYEMENAA
jgi:hypothetical protein